MRLNLKTTLFTAALAAVMVVVLIIVSLISFRYFSLQSAQEHARTAAEIVRVNLTEAMVNGTISQRAQFFDRLRHVDGLLSARVLRGPQVVNQFGAGLEEEQLQDRIEAEVLETGLPYFALENEGSAPVFRATIPFTADRTGNPDCLQCHQVPDGTVLGAVSLSISMAHLKQSALITIAAMVLTVGIFAAFTVLVVRHMTRPLVTTAADVQGAVADAIEGNFTHKIQRRTNDEVGQIADDLNKLTDYLHAGLSQISSNVAQLIRYKAPQNGHNLLNNTIGMVEALIEASQFKQAIEEDETKREVYCRIGRVLGDGFYIDHFSIYEVASSKNRMMPVLVDGQPDGGCRWCNPQILVRSEACRARRTGHIIDSIDHPDICVAFNPGDEHPPGAQGHICIPIIQSGSVGSVVQIICNTSEGKHFQELVPFIQVYLREAAPVIEAKRLMDTLRETNLRDPMTGLHNRRFLEEYMETLVATTNRRQAQLSVLMLDLDYFKKVNDTYGHDAGDAVLKSLAKVLRRVVRSSDLVIRYGGEEFMVILQETADNNGDTVAEKIREAVENEKVRLAGTTLQKTISIGIADFPRDADTLWQAIKYADVALYKAKEQGRNRVIHFKPEMWTENGDY